MEKMLYDEGSNMIEVDRVIFLLICSLGQKQVSYIK